MSKAPRPAVFSALALALVLTAMAPSWAAAQQTAFFFPSKTVCGYQPGNVPLLNDPYPNPNPYYEHVKPGNYATTFNVLNYNLTGNQSVSFYWSAPGQPLAPLATLPSPIITTIQFGCPEIAAFLGNPNQGFFFEGYLIIVVPNANFKVSGVYTFESQNAFERHILWWLNPDGTVTRTQAVHHDSLSEINGPVADVVQPAEARDIAASGAGGLGLGASIDIEWMKLIKVVIPDGEPNPMPIDPVLTTVE